ncbi:MAG: hypothetical protein BroJett033_2530 [Chloroflexota bacterium]|nr:MAG: hypothetical protein BroJett033_2530 [Chloroflexota bacterium]
MCIQRKMFVTDIGSFFGVQSRQRRSGSQPAQQRGALGLLQPGPGQNRVHHYTKDSVYWPATGWRAAAGGVEREPHLLYSKQCAVQLNDRGHPYVLFQWSSSGRHAA